MDLFVSLGLRDIGQYRVISIDDGWAGTRLPNGTIQADPVSFPSGIRALADYAHARNLSFGIYTSNSPTTCGGRPGSFGYEALDAATYASFGIDQLKIDNVRTAPTARDVLLFAVPACKLLAFFSQHPCLPSSFPLYPMRPPLLALLCFQCGDQNQIGPPERGYPLWRDVLNATGRPIIFDACEWAVDFPSTWMGPVANSWRTTYDM